MSSHWVIEDLNPSSIPVPMQLPNQPPIEAFYTAHYEMPNPEWEQPAMRRHSVMQIVSSPPRRSRATNLIIISDFQRGGWDADGGETRSLQLPAGTLITPISVAETELIANTSIIDVDFERSSAAGRERVEIRGRLSRVGNGAPTTPVMLEVDGRLIETQVAEFDEGGIAPVRFNPLTLPEVGTIRATLRIAEDALAADNQFHFALSSDQRLGVLILDGASTSERASFFLERALAIGNTPGFGTEIRRGEELRKRRSDSKSGRHFESDSHAFR